MKKQCSLGLATVLVAVAMVLSACGDDSKNSSAPAAGEASTAPAVSTVDVQTTIEQCDQYLARMHACVSTKMSEPEKQEMSLSLQKLEGMMAQAQDKEQLRQQCQRALDNIAQELKAFGCAV